MLYCYKLRVDLDTVSIDVVHEVLCKYFTDPPVWMYCIEKVGEDNPHSHWYFESNVVNTTIRASLRKILKSSGNRAYSLVQVEEKPVEYIAYIMKGKDFRYNNLDIDLIGRARDYDLKVKEEIKKKKENRKGMSVLEECRLKIDTVGYGNINIAHLIIETMLDRGLLIRRFQVQAIYDTLKFMYGTPEDWSDILDKMLK